MLFGIYLTPCLALQYVFVACDCTAKEILDRDKNLSDWVLSTNNFPADDRIWPSIGNGYMGAVVYSDVMHVNGLYSGRTTNSTHVNVPNPLSIRLHPSGSVLSHRYELHMYDGVFSERIETVEAILVLTIFAHREYKEIMVLNITVKAKDNVFHSDFAINVEYLERSLPLAVTDDINVLENKTEVLDDVLLRLFVASPAVMETDSVPTPILVIVNSVIPAQLRVPKGTASASWQFTAEVFMLSAEENRLFLDTYRNSNNTCELLAELRRSPQQQFCAEDPSKETLEGTCNCYGNNGQLHSSHVAAWHSIWLSADIKVFGNYNISQSVRASLYYILSSVPYGGAYGDDRYFGLSPGGLAHHSNRSLNYGGHVFWDQETWMLPPILAFHPKIVRKVLMDSRIKNLAQAKANANERGFKGAQYPWEAAYTGDEVTNWQPAADREIHVTGDISLGILHYFQSTQDVEFLTSSGAYKLLCEVAEFWSSRTTWLIDRSAYGVLDVMGPDEDHDHVNNSAYTNYVAKLCLEAPQKIHDILIKNKGTNIGDFSRSPEKNELMELPDPHWIEIASKMYMPYDDYLQYHVEFDRYVPGIKVKQADVVLLGYPLGAEMPSTVRENDLTIFENNTRDGPAMTWSMFSINWLDVKQTGKALQTFRRNFENIQGPFKIWTENSDGTGAVNFITGMGGFLQNILNGYFGYRILDGGFSFNALLIPETDGYEIVGLKYLGSNFSFIVTEANVQSTVKVPTNQEYWSLHRTGETMPIVVLNQQNNKATLERNGQYFVSKHKYS